MRPLGGREGEEDEEEEAAEGGGLRVSLYSVSRDTEEPRGGLEWNSNKSYI